MIVKIVLIIVMAALFACFVRQIIVDEKTKEREKYKSEIDKSILEQLKEDAPYTIIDFSKKPILENKEDFYKQIMEIAEKIQRTIDERRRNEQDGILIGSNGQLLQLYGNATVHDWIVWYIKEYKKGKL